MPFPTPTPSLPAPPRCEVPHFVPVRPGGVRARWRGAGRRRLLAAALATTAAALATGLTHGPARTASAPVAHPAAAGCGER
ncbi:hypothetical protein [Streptomyces sp. 769]|uniref:hypothetical protein n=1 Tax=Streptomyces sp. 769 TaxID=1262452 RepID=UPI00131C219D|nr:hypothetical protein [Streptomyces sp. 769]